MTGTLEQFSFLKGLLFFVLLSTSGFSSLILLIPTVLTIPIHSTIIIQWRRNYSSYISSLYFEYVVSLISLIGHTEVFIYSDDPSIFYPPATHNEMPQMTSSTTSKVPPSPRISSSTASLLQHIPPPQVGPIIPSATLIMSNNRSRVDYMFSGWCYATLTNRTANLKMIVKDFYRSIPIFGWAMQCMMYIFLIGASSSSSGSNSGSNTSSSIATTLGKRKREADVSSITKTFNYLLNLQIAQSSRYRIGFGNKFPLSLYFFPEGTDLSKQNRQKSNAFARSKQWSEWQYVLYPKSAGLSACLSCLRQWQPASVNDHNDEDDGDDIEDEDIVIVPSLVAQSLPSKSSSSKEPIVKDNQTDIITNQLHLSIPQNIDHSIVTSSSSNLTDSNNSKIHDITIAYKDHTPGVRPSEWSILQGKFPKEVHLIVRTFNMSDLLSYDDVQLQQWLREVFAYKEQLLHEYYTNTTTQQKSPLTSSSGKSNNDNDNVGVISNGSGGSTSNSIADVDATPAYDQIKWPPLLLQTSTSTSTSTSVNSDFVTQSNSTTVNNLSISTTHKVKTQSLINMKSFVFILLWTIFCIFTIIYFSWMRWLCTVMITVYIGTRLVNGIDQLELFLHYDMIHHEASITAAAADVWSSGGSCDEKAEVFSPIF